MAAPHVAGAAAILLSNNPSLSSIEVASILSETSAKGVVKDTGPGKSCSGVLNRDIRHFYCKYIHIRGLGWVVRTHQDTFLTIFVGVFVIMMSRLSKCTASDREFGSYLRGYKFIWSTSFVSSQLRGLGVVRLVIRL